MPRQRRCSHLSPEDRAVIMLARQGGDRVRSIARQLGRAPSTISRALRRLGPVGYSAAAAGRDYCQRRLRSRRDRRLVEGSASYGYVHDRLVIERWSPQQIAAKHAHHAATTTPGAWSVLRPSTPASRPSHVAG